MKKFCRILPIFLPLILLAGCSATVQTPPLAPDTRFPQVRGQTLEKREVKLPSDYAGQPVVLLVGYQQRAQFDIDRWILGLLQSEAGVKIVEVPTISGMMPTILQNTINDGMRSGIPTEDWGIVVTVYEDADKIISAIGNDRPQSAAVVLLDQSGRIDWLYNRGYSATKVLELKERAGRLRNSSTRLPTDNPKTSE
jgi:hypothetical protein